MLLFNNIEIYHQTMYWKSLSSQSIISVLLTVWLRDQHLRQSRRVALYMNDLPRRHKKLDNFCRDNLKRSSGKNFQEYYGLPWWQISIKQFQTFTYNPKKNIKFWVNFEAWKEKKILTDLILFHRISINWLNG